MINSSINSVDNYNSANPIWINSPILLGDNYKFMILSRDIFQFPLGTCPKFPQDLSSSINLQIPW